jgi:hypothetical protein
VLMIRRIRDSQQNARTGSISKRLEKRCA